MHELYDKWIAGDENKEFTKGGNLKAPSFEIMLSWVKVAWYSIDVQLIKVSVARHQVYRCHSPSCYISHAEVKKEARITVVKNQWH